MTWLHLALAAPWVVLAGLGLGTGFAVLVDAVLDGIVVDEVEDVVVVVTRRRP
jgi:hypothetical protein